MFNKIFAALALVLVSSLALAADFRPDMSEEEIEAEIQEELGLNSRRSAIGEERPTLEELVNEAIEAGVDIVSLTRAAMKHVSPYDNNSSNSARNIKSILVVAAPADKQVEVFQTADAVINHSADNLDSVRSRVRNQNMAGMLQRQANELRSTLGRDGYLGGGGSTATEAVSGDS